MALSFRGERLFYFKEVKKMKNTVFDNSDEVYFFMEEPPMKPVYCDDLEKNHIEADPQNGDEIYCANETARD